MIKRSPGHISFLSALLLAAFTMQGQNTELTGTWQVTRENNPMSTLEFSQKGDVITGYWVSPEGERAPLEEGAVAGPNLTFAFTHNGSRYLATGHIHRDSIDFNVQVEGTGTKIRAMAKRIGEQ